ncbi:hypothetical protein BGZ46_001004 [Entomortierella lignicola]|nr:hypothetical protein BGZ46_001004 [Entomortierella lignicola]
MSDPTRQPVTQNAGIETRTKLDTRLAQESAGKGDNTIHGIPPFTLPRADGTLEASIGVHASIPQTATTRMRRKGEVPWSDQDGDDNHTNQQGYRDAGRGDTDSTNIGTSSGKQGDSSSKHDPAGFAGALKSGTITRKSLLQRLRKAMFPTLLGVLVGWYYDAAGVLIYRSDPRIKG